MKQNIHPKYGEAKVTCACGNSFMSGSVNPELRVDVCSKCHPFFTGQQDVRDSLLHRDVLKNSTNATM